MEACDLLLKLRHTPRIEANHTPAASLQKSSSGNSNSSSSTEVSTTSQRCWPPSGTLKHCISTCLLKLILACVVLCFQSERMPKKAIDTMSVSHSLCRCIKELKVQTELRQNDDKTSSQLTVGPNYNKTKQSETNTKVKIKDRINKK